jgi:transposase
MVVAASHLERNMAESVVNRGETQTERFPHSLSHPPAPVASAPLVAGPDDPQTQFVATTTGAHRELSST